MCKSHQKWGMCCKLEAWYKQPPSIIYPWRMHKNWHERWNMSEARGICHPETEHSYSWIMCYPWHKGIYLCETKRKPQTLESKRAISRANQREVGKRHRINKLLCVHKGCSNYTERGGVCCSHGGNVWHKFFRYDGYTNNIMDWFFLKEKTPGPSGTVVDLLF